MEIEAREMNKMKSFFVLIIASLIFAAPISATARDNFRCSGRIIEAGQTQDYVLKKCGQPSYIDKKSEKFAADFRHRYPENQEGYNYIIRENRIEVWTYNRGPSQFVRYLTFRNGKLTDISTGDYGY